MNQGLQHPPGDGDHSDGTAGSGPYAQLGLEPGASFDAVQAAKGARLAEVGDDPLARSRIEAAYDAVLMERLKQRQQGKVSTAALSASEREQAAAAPRPALPRLPQLRLPSAPASRPGDGTPRLPQLPELAPASGRALWIPLGLGAVLLALLLLGAMPAELLLALAAIGTLVALQRRIRRLLPALGWSLGALSAGMLLGGLLVRLIDPALPLGLPLAAVQVQSLPALLLLLLAAVLIG